MTGSCRYQLGVATRSKALHGKSAYGRGVSPPQAELAHRRWRAAVAYAVRYFGDVALAAEIVEGVVQSAAKAHRHKLIKNPDSYLPSGVWGGSRTTGEGAASRIRGLS